MCNINLTPAQKAKLTKANNLIATVLEESGVQYLSGKSFSDPIQVFNYPSGNLEPSEADVKMTKKIAQACKLADIQLLDHLIISAKDYHSFAENWQMPEVE